MPSALLTSSTRASMPAPSACSDVPSYKQEQYDCLADQAPANVLTCILLLSTLHLFAPACTLL